MTKKLLPIIFLFILSNSFAQGSRKLSMGELVPIVLKLNWPSGKSIYKVTGTKYKSIKLVGEEKFEAKDWTVLPYKRGIIFKNEKENLEIRLYAETNVPYHYLDDPSKSGKSISGDKVNSFWVRNGRKTNIRNYVSIRFYSKRIKGIDVEIKYSEREKYNFDLNAEKLFKY